MTEAESSAALARELLSFAGERGVDLGASYQDWAFFQNGRFIILWRGDGKVLYNMQGRVLDLPVEFRASAGAFRGMWHEAGSLTNLEQAFELLKAWLIDGREVDDLPDRSRRRWGIG